VTSKGSFWHHEEKIQEIQHDGKKEQVEMSVTQVMKQYQSILEEEIHEMTYITGAVKRKGKLDVVTFVQSLIFGLRPRS
jgi:hypothetical protein